MNILKSHTKNGIEIIDINSETMGSHGAHWQAVCDNASETVPSWLHSMLDVAVMPRGMHHTHDALPKDVLLLTTEQLFHPCQVLSVDAEGTPTELITAFPSVDSPYGVNARIVRIIQNVDTGEALLRLETDDDITLFAHDALYPINKDAYHAETLYTIALSGIAHNLEVVNEENSTLNIEDADAIRHHRALNDILTENNGKAPADLQEQLAQWQPQSSEDLLPITLNLNNLCAYLFGETFGQEDEAWVQGKVVGLQKITILEEPLVALDIVVLREQSAQPIVVRTIIHQKNTPQPLQVNDFVRGNIWLQAKVYGKTNT